jgi:hypothetical protein
MPRLRKQDRARPRTDISESVWRWLVDENPEERDEDGEFSWQIFALSGDDAKLKELWQAVEPDVLAYWIPLHPGTRPPLWWKYSAPRQAAGEWPGCYWDGTLPEPLERIGGIGDAPWDAGLAYVPSFACGLPKDWEGFDPDDPPTYESEASYLKRHGLLVTGELKRLPKDAFEPVTLTFDLEEEKS